MKRIEWENYQDGDSTPLNAENLNLMQDNIEEEFGKLLNFFYPIGTIYETTSANLDTTTKMTTHFGGTWERYGNGRVTVAMGGTSFDTIGKTGGAKTVLLTRDNLPNSVADEFYNNSGSGKPGAVLGSIANGTYGISSAAYSGLPVNQPHNNLQPYIVVYRYRRIA